MRKIIIILCLVALVVTMAVPAFAEDASSSAIGEWVFNDSIERSSYKSDYSWDINFTSNGKNWKRLDPEYLNNTQIRFWTSSTHEVVYSSWWTDNAYKTIMITGGEDVKDANLLSFLTANATRIVCDGTSCPATDANEDNFCDDCGAMFSVLRDYGWPDPYSVWTTEKQETFPYCMMYEDINGDKVLVMSATRPYYDMDMIIIPDASSGTTYASYNIFGNEWRLSSSYKVGTEIISGRTYPSFNMFNGDDTLIVMPQDTDFFLVPLWMIPSQVTQGQTVAQSVGGTMRVLTLCGVGLMVCLMAFFLLFKVLRIFHR